MKHIYKLIILTLILSLSSGFLFAQKKYDKRLKKADEAYERGEYFTAIKSYTSLIKKIKNKNLREDINFKIAESYFNIFDYKRARSQYKKTTKNSEYHYFAYLRLADIEIHEDNYEEAISIYNQILEKYPGDSLAVLALESCNLSLEWRTLRTRYQIEPAKFLNTKENEFGAFVDEKSGGYDHIYFASNRKEAKGKKNSKITGKRYNDLFFTKFDKQEKWSKPEGLDSLNTDYDEGTPFVFDQGRKMYYTSCLAEKNRVKGCQIYEATKVDGIWMNSKRLEFVGDSISVGHPALSPDGKTLYFSARIEGGYGGSDIWYVEQTSEGWSKPRNMGKQINSSGDELFPFIKDDSTFYYSSTKHPSMGGLDIFCAKKDMNGVWVSENMKPPFNSNGNDFGIFFYSKEDRGYFTSDRKTREGQSAKGEDIYYFWKTPLEFEINGIVKDKDNLHALDSCIIILYGSDGSTFVDTTFTNHKDKKLNGTFNFKLKPKTDYVFLVTKNKYFNGKSKLSTDSLEFSQTFDFEILLENYEKTFEIPNIEFEFGKWTLSESSKSTLDSLVNIMHDNPGIIIELSAHTDMIGTEESNMELSQKRANSVLEYLKTKGLQDGRIEAKGYGKSKPKTITANDNQYPFLRKGTILTEDFINSLKKEEQEIANQQNRRIEMQVISNDYIFDLDF